MVWIKRNLFFFIGGLIALALLGAAGWYNYSNWARNADEFDKLSALYDQLKQVTNPDISPGDEQHPRIQEAIDQTLQLSNWVQQAKGSFQPIDAVPAFTKPNSITSEAFAAALRRTIDALQHEAESAHVDLPNGYGFSFEAERTQVTFGQNSLDPLATQLGEVKAISEVLYAAGVNNFDGIQRVRMTDEDANGQASDYVNSQVTSVGNYATVTPYVVTFRSFTPEIAQVFSGFATSPHGFVIKSLNVSPSANDANASAQGTPPPLPPKGTLVTFLKEKLLRVSMEVDIVKLTPPKS